MRALFSPFKECPLIILAARKLVILAKGNNFVYGSACVCAIDIFKAHLTLWSFTRHTGIRDTANFQGPMCWELTEL